MKFGLGSVDILFQPDESADEAQEAHEAPGELVKPREDPTVVLDLVDEALHQVTLSVYMLIVLPPHLAVGPG